jgi:hypothetical protein
MSSNRASNPVKLFIGVLTVEDVNVEERLEERLIAEYGPSDHRLSLISSDGTIHRLFLSFELLIETGSLPKTREISQSIEKEFSTKTVVGFVDNRRVTVGMGLESDAGEIVIQFKDGGIQFIPGTHPDYISDISQEFFLFMRKTYRAQLRSMCLLRR